MAMTKHSESILGSNALSILVNRDWFCHDLWLIVRCSSQGQPEPTTANPETGETLGLLQAERKVAALWSEAPLTALTVVLAGTGTVD